ncbi:hypothetical protein Ancab_017909 [Ancistrocladus abbreviatus]
MQLYVPNHDVLTALQGKDFDLILGYHRGPFRGLGQFIAPLATAFEASAGPTMVAIISIIASENSPLLANVYPYFAYASDPTDIRLEYAQFTAAEVVVQDGSLSYTNQFDAMIDAFFWAMENSGAGNLDVVVSESGWPHDGNGNLTTPDLAATYSRNYMRHVNNSSGGTPKRPSTLREGYMFCYV